MAEINDNALGLDLPEPEINPEGWTPPPPAFEDGTLRFLESGGIYGIWIYVSMFGSRAQHDYESAREAQKRAIAGLDSTDAARLYTPTADGYVLNLTDLPILKDGKKFTLGTLTFHRDGGPRRYGWVDVDIPCIPSLQRISYKTADQWGDNYGFKSPITRGEVFVGGGGRYWICVRVSTGNNYEQSGVLINMQPGKGDKWKYIYEDEKWAAWDLQTT